MDGKNDDDNGLFFIETRTLRHAPREIRLHTSAHDAFELIGMGPQSGNWHKGKNTCLSSSIIITINGNHVVNPRIDITLFTSKQVV